MGYIQKIFMIHVFIRIFHCTKQLSVCLFLLTPLTCAATIHSKGKAITHVLFIAVTWMFVPQISYLEKDKEKKCQYVTCFCSRIHHAISQLHNKKDKFSHSRETQVHYDTSAFGNGKTENLTTSLTILFQTMSLQKEVSSGNTFL